MKAVWTSGKRKKTNIKISNIKLNWENGELIIVSSLTNLLREENLERLKSLSGIDFNEKVGEFGGCHLFNSLPSDKDETMYLKDDNVYLFDNDEDGTPPNIHKVLKKTNTKEVSFFVNPSNIFTGDFLEDYPFFKGKDRPRDGKFLKIEDSDLVFCCVPDSERGVCKTQFNKNEIKKFSSNMNLFIKDRIKKKKIIKFKVPNGIYGIDSIRNRPIWFENISEFVEPGELLGHYIKKFQSELRVPNLERLNSDFIEWKNKRSKKRKK